MGKKAADQRLNRIVADYVKGRYEQSNAILQKFCPFDLAGLGYSL